MKITVRARPGSKTVYVKPSETSLFEKPGRREFLVGVKESAKDGRANRAIEEAIAAFFHVPPSRVHIVAGHAARVKVMEVDGVGAGL